MRRADSSGRTGAAVRPWGRMSGIAVVLALTLRGTTLGAHPPVNPDATPEARAVLQYLYDITGKGIIAGVHGENWSTDRLFELMKTETGRYPGFYSNDFRYGNELESRRRNVVNEMKEKWHQDKVICSLMWHMARPLDPESSLWDNVQSAKLTEGETDKLLTPGTDWHDAWMKKLDGIAAYLKELHDDNVPILWRPFHEMNGGWFWWGKNPRFAEIWIQMYERFTNHHKLDNLLWVWSPNCVVYNAGKLPDYFPGHDYVDVLASDIYANKSYDWEQYFHDDLLAMAGGKPISMGEVGDMPDPAFLKEHQPNWVIFMVWPGYEHQYANNVTRNKYVFAHEWTITAEELPAEVFSGATAARGATDGRMVSARPAGEGTSVVYSLDGRAISALRGRSAVRFVLLPGIGIRLSSSPGAQQTK